MKGQFEHEPVLVASVLHYLDVQPEGLYVDCTVGGGGHARAILDQAHGGAQLIGIDRDPQAIAAASAELSGYGDRVRIVRGNFRNIGSILDGLGVDKVNGILVDLGVSSHQLDSEERGFSYWEEALDMRMGPDAPRTAAQLVMELDEDELARIFYEYGEERWARRIARAIVFHRQEQPIETATRLAEIIKSAIPAAARRHGPHPARRSFQALRIAVNDELGALRDFLAVAVDRLAPKGRLVVISFHSIEDRMVKKAFVQQAQGCICPSDLPLCACGKEPRVRILTRKPVVADRKEVESNPRARSAKLRAVEKFLAKE